MHHSEDSVDMAISDHRAMMAAYKRKRPVLHTMIAEPKCCKNLNRWDPSCWCPEFEKRLHEVASSINFPVEALEGIKDVPGIRRRTVVLCGLLEFVNKRIEHHQRWLAYWEKVDAEIVATLCPCNPSSPCHHAPRACHAICSRCTSLAHDQVREWNAG